MGWPYGTWLALDVPLIFCWPGRRSRDEFREPGDCIQHRLWGKAAKPPKLNDQKEQLLKQMIEDNASYPAAGMHYIHDAIYPLEIRDYIIRALEICQDRRTGSVSEHRMANWPTKF